MASNSSTDLVLVGRLAAVHGLDGALVTVSESDNPERFALGARLRCDHPEYPLLVVTETGRNSKGALLLSFSGVTDRTRAEQLVGSLLMIDPRHRRPLEEGEFWPDELIGLDVRADGHVIGHVADVVLEPQTRLVVRSGEAVESEVPFVAELVPVVDLAAGYVEIVPIEGLISPR